MSLWTQITELTGNLSQRLPDLITTNNILVGTGLLIVFFNLKGLPGVWHYRIFKGLFTQLYLTKPIRPEPDGLVASLIDAQGQARPQLFAFFITTTASTPVIECDYNMHKSNSTFFSDLDINRTQLVVALFKTVLWPALLDRRVRKKPLRIALGGTSCIFRREIKPFQSYEVWSRVLAWDEKWLYMVSYFVKKGTSTRIKKSVVEGIQTPESDVLASCVARYVFKDGRVTVRPAAVLEEVGFIPATTTVTDAKPVAEGKWSAEQYEDERKHGMEMAGLFTGLEGLPGRFDPVGNGVLGECTDL